MKRLLLTIPVALLTLPCALGWLLTLYAAVTGSSAALVLLAPLGLALGAAGGLYRRFARRDQHVRASLAACAVLAVAAYFMLAAFGTTVEPEYSSHGVVF